MSLKPTNYATRQDAIQREIADALGSGPWPHTDLNSALRYDLSAIADEVLSGLENGYALKPGIEHDDFWAAVARHERPASAFRAQVTEINVGGFDTVTVTNPDGEPVAEFTVASSEDPEPYAAALAEAEFAGAEWISSGL